MPAATDIARRAADLVGGDRARQHGDKADNFARIAAYWTAYLSTRRDVPLSGVDVGNMMAMLKIARTQSGDVSCEDWVDGCGYLACAAEIATEAA